MEVTFCIELRPEYVDTAGIKRHATVEVIGDYISLGDDKVIATHHSSPVFTSDQSDVVGIRIVGQAPSPPPRFTDREGLPWTAEEDDALRELSAAGASMGGMGYELGRRLVEIRKRTEQLGLPRARQ